MSIKEYRLQLTTTHKEKFLNAKSRTYTFDRTLQYFSLYILYAVKINAIDQDAEFATGHIELLLFRQTPLP